ncbi:hypothetical protein GCM10017566_11440 [Amycolatopsis bartoniae]|uniref:Uncharacterized protein n=1 Tax=Amycolatopsis bartoniae TaxID=941986 RepID=A0A8H9IS85_9PSEU|nr:hypothetical protein GCM10017566_11440 [Amycolatopsis bartoniae]
MPGFVVRSVSSSTGVTVAYGRAVVVGAVLGGGVVTPGAGVAPSVVAVQPATAKTAARTAKRLNGRVPMLVPQV